MSPDRPTAAGDIPQEIAERVRRRGAATIYDVADLAGVNPSTVSRALTKPGRVSRVTTARVQDAADRLEFRINPAARALQTGRTNTIGLIVADITNPVVFGIVRGAESAASDAGFTLVFAESQESGEAEVEAIERLSPGVDGIVMATTRLGDDPIRAIAERKPVVLINRAVDGVPSVLPDVESGVGELMGHLADLGHRSIAYLAGPESSWIDRRRFAAMLDYAERADIALVEIGPNPPTIDGGRALLRRVRASRVTAAIAFNDRIAIGLMQSAATAGTTVPGQLSVAGFDDIFGSELIVPALTTVRAQLVKAGEQAVLDLLTRLDGREAPPSALLTTELIVRGSTGPAQSGASSAASSDPT